MEAIVWVDKYLSNMEQLVNEGQVDEALAGLNSVLFDEPGYAPLHNFIGWVHMYYTNNPAQAELHFRTAIRFNETYAPPYLHLANLFNRSTRYAEAIETINPALDKVGDLRTGLQEALALAYEMRGEYQKAIRAYKGAATATAVNMEVERMLKSVRRCRRKRIAFLFAM